MKFAHLADSHLGYRQYGLLEREQDFYDVFDKCVDKIIEEKCDFVIHSGDLFDKSQPSPNALLRFQKSFFRLKEANIPVYAIAGNHDSVRKKGVIPPQVLFRDLGLILLSPNHPMDSYNGVLICGMPYVTKSNKSVLREAYKLFEEEANKYVTSILVAHQGIDKYLPFNPELEIGDLPDNFDYYAMGHIHNYINDAYGKGRLVYPGSSEISKSDEVLDYNKKGKGFAIVELTDGEPLVKRVTVDLPRKFIKTTINYDDLDKKLSLIKNKIKDLEKPPVVEIVVENGDFSASEVNEIIREALNDYCLVLRPKFKPNKSNDEILTGDSNLGSRQLLAEALNKKYNNSKITDFAVELLNSLSHDGSEEASLVCENFYNKHFASDRLNEIDSNIKKLDDFNVDNDETESNDDLNNNSNNDLSSNELNNDLEESDESKESNKIINKTNPIIQEKLESNNKKFKSSEDFEDKNREALDSESVIREKLDKNQTTLFIER